jgi:hypothetical protein
MASENYNLFFAKLILCANTMAVEIMLWPIALGVKGLFRNGSFLEMGTEQ